MTTNEMLFAALVVLQVLDMYTTVRAMRHGHTEANKYVAWLMDKIGVIPAMLLPKILVMGFFGFYLSEWPWFVLAGLVCFYVWVVQHNYRTVKE